MKLLSIGDDSKTIKGEKFGFLTGIQFLAPSMSSGVNLCPNASPGCIAACLFTSGFAGVYKTVNEARVKRAHFFLKDRANYFTQLIEEVKSLIVKAAKENKKVAIRLNGVSDVAFESIKYNGKNIMEYFPDIQFYDYTKSAARMFRFLQGSFPANYHLTFSRSETNQADVNNILKLGGNVAVVFHANHPDEFPAKYLNKRVINGDESDLRFNDAKNVVVGLKAKGSKGKRDESGFVI